MAGERRKRKTEGVPVLKLPPHYLGDVLKALQSNEFDRDGFREAVMELFGSEMEEKSVFRGMAIPTLRALGLMMGFEREMRLTADGAIVGMGLSRRPMDKKPLAIVLQGIEKRRHLDFFRAKKRVQEKELLGLLVEQECANGTPKGDVVGRVRRWLGYLQYAELLELGGVPLAFSRKSVPLKPIAQKEFSKRLRRCYRELTPGTVGEAIVAMDDLRRSMAQSFYRDGVILSSSGFDERLERMLGESETPVYLHRSMGADEALFVSQGIGYSSISIRGVR